MHKKDTSPTSTHEHKAQGTSSARSLDRARGKQTAFAVRSGAIDLVVFASAAWSCSSSAGSSRSRRPPLELLQGQVLQSRHIPQHWSHDLEHY